MNDRIAFCLTLIPALPLLAAIVIGVLGAKVLKAYSNLPVILALVASCGLSLVLLTEVSSEQNRLTGTAQGAAGFEQVVRLWTWANVPDAYTPPSSIAQPEAAHPFRIDIALRADALTSMMLAMVTFVSTLVAVFASGYMDGDRGYWRFFAYIGLFVFSMTMLVSVSNFVLLFVFWEAVGVCSYLLIGFWYEKPAAAAAGVKAFLVNRVGDFGFALALFLIWTTYGTLNYHDSLADGTIEPEAVARAQADPASPAQFIQGVLSPSRIQANGYFQGGLATAICLLLLLGACGKSAQFPLHVWLPDAMEGPTPVSALIHAATMVTAGVYMVARCTPLFAVSPTAQVVVAAVGAFTALLAGLIALTQFDLKRVLAYSTISQLGYMFLALGAGTVAGVTGGMFHLFTHAFFKALLFLAAGSVMHAMGGVIDMREFGGLRKLMPWTHATFLIGALALAGIFPLAGFWSKDAVLASVHDKIHAIDHELEHRNLPAGSPSHHGESPSDKPGPLAAWSDGQLHAFHTIYEVANYAALATVFLTAFYTFRAFAMTFYGELQVPHQAGHHAHEAPPIMVVPLAVLAFCSVIVGMVFLRRGGSVNLFTDFLTQTPSLASGAIALTREPGQFHLEIAGWGTALALAGIVLALFLYLGERSEALFLQRLFDLKWAERLTDPQWVVQLERVWWIGAITRLLRRNHFGWLVTAVGYILATLSLILAIPLLVGQFLSPYKLSLNKFYFDELYSALLVWPLRVLSAVCYWIDRWIVDGAVNLAGTLPPAIGTLMRPMQMGLVQFYALAMVLGALILVAARMIWAAG